MLSESTRKSSFPHRISELTGEEFDWVEFSPPTPHPSEQGRLISTPVGEVALFQVGDEYFAIQNHCPHKGAALVSGTIRDGAVQCPLHNWEFDLRTGECRNRLSQPLQRYPVLVNEGMISIGVPKSTVSDSERQNGIHRVLVSYSRLGWVECFGTIEQMICKAGDQVLIQTARGIELGRVLLGNDRGNATNEQPTGELLRLLTEADSQGLSSRRDVSEEVLLRAKTLLGQRSLPVEVIDAEQLFDGNTVILYYLGMHSEELGRIAVELGEDQEQRVVFQPVRETPKTSGCGAGGCGSGECSSKNE